MFESDGLPAVMQWIRRNQANLRSEVAQFTVQRTIDQFFDQNFDNFFMIGQVFSSMITLIKGNSP